MDYSQWRRSNNIDQQSAFGSGYDQFMNDNPMARSVDPFSFFDKLSTFAGRFTGNDDGESATANMPGTLGDQAGSNSDYLNDPSMQGAMDARSFDESGDYGADYGLGPDDQSSEYSGPDFGQEFGGEYKRGGSVKGYAAGGAPMAVRTGSTQPGYIYTNPGGGISYNGSNVPPGGGVNSFAGAGGMQSAGSRAPSVPTHSTPMPRPGSSYGWGGRNYASGRNSFSFDDGGAVPDENADGVLDFSDKPQEQAPDDVFDVVRSAFEYGRQKYNITGAKAAAPPKVKAFADGGSVDDEDPVGVIPDDEDLPPDASRSMPQFSTPDEEPQAQQQDDPRIVRPGLLTLPGSIDDGSTDAHDELARASGQPQEGTGEEDPAKKYLGRPIKEAAQSYGKAIQAFIAKYLTADAAPPQSAKAMEQQVDPQGQQSQGQRSLNSIVAASQKYGPAAGWSMVQYNRQAYEAKRAFAAAALNGAGGKPGDLSAAANAANSMYDHMPDGLDVRFAPSQNGVTVAVNGRQLANLTPQQFNQFLRGTDGQFDQVFDRKGPAVFSNLAKGQGLQLQPIQGQGPQSVSPPVAKNVNQFANRGPAPQVRPDGSPLQAQAQGATEEAKPRSRYGAYGDHLIEVGFDPKEVDQAFAIAGGNVEKARAILAERRPEIEANQTKVDVANAGADARRYNADQSTTRQAMRNQNQMAIAQATIKSKEFIAALTRAQQSGDKNVLAAAKVIATAAQPGNTVDPMVVTRANRVLQGLGVPVPQAKAPQAQTPNARTSIPQGAIDMLRNDPGLADAFNEKYGEGAADQYLQGE
jgi:hypothetical protein